MKLSAVVAAKNSAERLPILLAQLAMLADELVVIVDDSSSDDSEDVARSFTSHVFNFTHDTLFNGFRTEVWKRCSGDWILRIDDDETLSAAWTREYLNQLMNSKRITHYFIPRRWLIDEGRRYICNVPWFPDFQLRLMRNIPSIVEAPLSLHRPRRIAGEAGYLTDLHIYHWNLLVYDRLQREQKVNEYAKADPITPCSQFYLFEDYYYQAETYLDRPVQRAALTGPLDVGNSPYCVNMYIRQTPQRFVAGQSYSVKIELLNRSTRVLEPIPYREPHNISFAHHWYQRRHGGAVLHEYGASRCPLSTAIPPGNSHRALVDVCAPLVPGEYMFSVDVVEEFKAWFSDTDSSGHYEYRSVSVERDA